MIISSNGIIKSTYSITEQIPGWLLPVTYLFLLPFGNLYIIPLVLMLLISLIQFRFNKVIYNIRENKDYRFLILVFGLIWLPMVFSLPDAINFKHSLKSTLGIMPYIFVGFYIMNSLKKNTSRKYLQIAVIVITTLWCVNALLFYMNIIKSENLQFWDVFNYAEPFKPGSPVLGLVLAVTLPVVLEGLRRMANGYFYSFLACIICIMHIVVIFLSGNRTAILMLIFGSLIWLFYVTYKNESYTWKKVISIYAIIISIAGFIAYQQPTRLNSITTVFDTDLKTIDTMSSGRLALWETAGRISLDHWFNGVGPRGFRYSYDDYRPAIGKYSTEYPKSGSTHPHFSLLEILAETGMIGFISVFIALYLLFQRLRYLPNVQQLIIFPWFLGATIAIVPNIAKAFYSSYWLSLILWMIFIGVALTTYKDT